MAVDRRIKLTVLRLHVIWQFLFYFSALVILVVISFWVLRQYRLTPAFTLQNYSEILSNIVYSKAAVISVWLSLSTAVVATVLALPLVQALHFHLSRQIRVLVIFGLFLPFFSSYTIRMFAWQAWLNDSGIISHLLTRIGFLHGNLGLIYTEVATRIGLLSFLIAIAALVVSISVSRLERSFILAARNLGASSWQVYRHIIFPFALPGALIALLVTFVITLGDFISPSILGGNQLYTLSTLILDRVRINDWPTAAGLGVVMLAISGVVFLVIFGALKLLPVMKGVKVRA